MREESEEAAKCKEQELLRVLPKTKIPKEVSLVPLYFKENEKTNEQFGGGGGSARFSGFYLNYYLTLTTNPIFLSTICKAGL